MECNTEWNILCRICLQDGQMCSIFEKDDSGMYIYEKIMRCSNVEIQRGTNLPEQICCNCVDELNIAYKFRTNCENSDVVLQSFVQKVNVTDVTIKGKGEIYKYRPPKDLRVKRIKSTGNKINVIEEFNENSEYILNDDGYENVENDGVEEIPEGIILSAITEEDMDESEQSQILEIDPDVIIKPDPDQDSTEHFVISESELMYDVKDPNILSQQMCSSVSQSPVKFYEAEEVSQRGDGTTVIKVRKSSRDNKPMKICEICGNTYKYKHALEAHMRRHRNEKPFACEICGRAFVLNVELRCHMRTHTGQKPYACRYCNRCFSDFGSRIKHERTHTGERPYVCDTCGKGFAYSYGLSSHILTHTGEKPFSCDQCGKRFTKKHHLKAHLKTHEKNKNKQIMKAVPKFVLSTLNDEDIIDDGMCKDTQIKYEID